MRILAALLLTAFLIYNLYILVGNTEEHINHKNSNQEPSSVTNELLNHRITNSAPVELGKVNWLRNFDEAVKEAKVQNNPLLVFFQEVPGCSTSSGYGKNVMSHPLIVEAIESLFVPVAIYNNRDGHDYQILKSFGEPSWNNPVVRIMTYDRTELVPRLNGDYSKLGLVKAMIKALENNNQTVPNYLRLLNEELQADVRVKEKAVFAMSCFWSGEEALGRIEGVTSTNPGFMEGREVVEVEYDPHLISYNDLLNRAKKGQAADHVFVNDGNKKNVAEMALGKSSVSDVSDFRPDSDPKHYLSHTIYKYIPMTSLQASRVNAAIGSGTSPDNYLSPRQLELLKYVKDHPEIDWQSTVGLDFPAAWNSAVTLVNRKVGMK